MTYSTAVRLAMVVLVCIAVGVLADKLMVTVGAPEVVIRQGAIDGKLTVWTQPGVQWQNFGHVSTYKKSVQSWFQKTTEEQIDKDGNKKTVQVDGDSIKVRFNDGGHAQLSGSLRVMLPMDSAHLIKLHTTYGSQEAVEHDLIKQVVTKAVYLTGTLMSSKESSSERRPDLIRFIEDQIAYGVYRTTTREQETIDPLTGQKKTVSVVDIVMDPKSPQGMARQEKSPFSEFGLSVSNLTINSIDYDQDVENQIKQQQKAIMDVQTAQAQSKTAEQRALTAKAQGEADAAAAKWKQETIKAQAVTEAEQKTAVAEQELKAAQFKRDALIAEGEGQAQKMKLIMGANGALDQKLATYERVMTKGLEMLGRQPLVPSVVMGSGSGSTNSMALLEMLQAKVAKDLSLEMGVK